MSRSKKTPTASLARIVSEASTPELKEEYSKSSDKWPNDVVFAIYCNDDLTKLPVKILEQMESHITNILIPKRAIELKERRASCTHTRPDGRSAFEFRGMQWNGYEQCTLCDKIK